MIDFHNAIAHPQRDKSIARMEDYMHVHCKCILVISSLILDIYFFVRLEVIKLLHICIYAHFSYFLHTLNVSREGHYTNYISYFVYLLMLSSAYSVCKILIF